MIKILFVCHGNICRSPMAESVMTDLVQKLGAEEQFEIASAAVTDEEIYRGVGNPVHHGTRQKLAEVGIYCIPHRATIMKKADYAYYDYLIGMDNWNVKMMTRIAGGRDPENKICKMLDFTNRGGEVADPWYTGNFDASYRDIREGCLGLLKHLGYDTRKL